MPEIIFPGAAGRLEGKYSEGIDPKAPVALILHPHPQHGGTMNNKVVYALYKTFVEKGFTTLRFNFRGIGRSEGSYDNGEGELSDAASAMDWLQNVYPQAREFWVAGFSFGAWICMQLLMRRPEIKSFVAVSPPADRYDFTFLAPCPVSGYILQGSNDTIVTPASVERLSSKLDQQRGITVDFTMIEDADHFFAGKLNLLSSHVGNYLERTTDHPNGHPVNLKKTA